MFTHQVPTTLSVLLAGAALSFVGGCGSDDTSADAGSSPAGAAEPAERPTLTTVSGPQPVTPAGDVAVGDTATFTAGILDGTETFDAPLRVGISKITKGAPSDLAPFDLEQKDKAATPYYVKASFRNLSADRSWNPIGMPGAFVALTESGKQVGTITLVGAFPKCQDDRPSMLKPGETMRTCTVYLVPKGETLSQVTHRDAESADYTWKAS